MEPTKIILTFILCFFSFYIFAQISPPPAPAPPPFKNKILIPVIGANDLYSIEGFHSDYNILKTKKGYTVINNDSKKKATYYFETIRKQAEFPRQLDIYGKSHDYYIIKKDGKIGIINSEGKLFIPMEYELLSGFLAKKNGKYGSVSLKNETVIPFIYDRLEGNLFTPTLTATLDGMKGVIDKNGNTLVDFKYKYVRFLSENYIAVSTSRLHFIRDKIKDNSLTIIDLKGTKMSEDAFNDIKELENDYFIVKTMNEKFGVFKPDSNYTIEPIYDVIKKGFVYFNLIAKKNDKYGIIRIDGKSLVDFKYDSIVEEGSIYKASLNNKYGFIGYDQEGFKEITEFIYDELGKFSFWNRINFTIGETKGYLKYIESTNSFKSY